MCIACIWDGNCISSGIRLLLLVANCCFATWRVLEQKFKAISEMNWSISMIQTDGLCLEETQVTWIWYIHVIVCNFVCVTCVTWHFLFSLWWTDFYCFICFFGVLVRCRIWMFCFFCLMFWFVADTRYFGLLVWCLGLFQILDVLFVFVFLVCLRYWMFYFVCLVFWFVADTR